MTPSFWDHLDELRRVIIRSLIAWAVCFVLVFGLRKVLFGVLFAPAQTDFIVYRLLCRLANRTGWDSLCPSDFTPQFINTQLAAQFTTHLEVAAVAALVVALPFIIWQLYTFVAPALYQNEKKAAGRIIGFGTLLFVCGILLNYFIIFPFAFRFLSTYQVEEVVVNQISLNSYVSTLLILSLIMGLLFEMPLVAWALSKAGLLKAQWLKQYRRHAFVGLCILAAVITPTGDAFTLMLVTMPLYLLYELSILVTH